MVVMFVIVVFVVYGTLRTIPTVESYGGRRWKLGEFGARKFMAGSFIQI
jgi:hypothetical protein